MIDKKYGKWITITQSSLDNFRETGKDWRDEYYRCGFCNAYFDFPGDRFYMSLFQRTSNCGNPKICYTCYHDYENERYMYAAWLLKYNDFLELKQKIKRDYFYFVQLEGLE